MGIHFIGGERVQRGSGIGGLLRFVKKLFSPIAQIAKKALQSDSGKKLVQAVKEQAIDSSINVASNIAQGKDIKESFIVEADKAKKNSKRRIGDLGVGYLKGLKEVKNEIPKPIKKKRNYIIKKGKLKFKRDIFE